MTPTSTAVPAPEVGDRPPKLDAFRPPRPWAAWLGSLFSEPSIAILATAGILIHLVLRYVVNASPLASHAPLYVILVLGGAPLVVTLIRKALIREFGSDLLAGISIVTAVLLGEYLVGCIVVLMLSGGESLEQFASRRASSVLDALAKRMPQSAHCQMGDALRDVALKDVAVGDRLVVFPHEICPVDGVVLEGQGKMNEAYLTGEPFEISK